MRLARSSVALRSRARSRDRDAARGSRDRDASATTLAMQLHRARDRGGNPVHRRPRTAAPAPVSTMPRASAAALARIEATRTQPEQRALPLLVGDAVVLGARRLHVLPTPLSSFVACATDEIASLAVVCRSVAVATGDAHEDARGAAPDRYVGTAEGAGRRRCRPLPAAPMRRGARSNCWRRRQRGAGRCPALRACPRRSASTGAATRCGAATLAVAASVLRQMPAEAICLVRRRRASRAAASATARCAHCSTRVPRPRPPTGSRCAPN